MRSAPTLPLLLLALLLAPAAAQEDGAAEPWRRPAMEAWFVFHLDDQARGLFQLACAPEAGEARVHLRTRHEFVDDPAAPPVVIEAEAMAGEGALLPLESLRVRSTHGEDWFAYQLLVAAGTLRLEAAGAAPTTRPLARAGGELPLLAEVSLPALVELLAFQPGLAAEVEVWGLEPAVVRHRLAYEGERPAGEYVTAHRVPGLDRLDPALRLHRFSLTPSPADGAATPAGPAIELWVDAEHRTRVVHHHGFYTLSRATEAEARAALAAAAAR